MEREETSVLDGDQGPVGHAGIGSREAGLTVGKST